MIDKTVTVYTAYDERRSSIDVTVALDTDLDVVETIVHDTLTKIDLVNRATVSESPAADSESSPTFATLPLQASRPDPLMPRTWKVHQSQ